jgi:hypothetical protein
MKSKPGHERESVHQPPYQSKDCPYPQYIVEVSDHIISVVENDI